MTLLHHNRIYKMLAVILVICLLVSCCFCVKAYALATEVVVVTASAFAIVASILYAMGISKGSSPTAFNSLRDAVVLNLQGLGYVSADGKINLYGFGAGVATVGLNVISAVRSFLFDSSHPVISSYSFSNHGGFTVDGSLVTSWSSSVPCSLICFYSFPPNNTLNAQLILVASLQNKDAPITFSDGVTRTFSYEAAGYSYCGVRGYSVVNLDFYKSFNCTCIPWNPDDYPEHFYPLPDHMIVDSDVNVSSAVSDGLDKDTPFDVIYPGWAQWSENLDTNIEQDLDHDGAIDNIIPADRYYPISVPVDATDVFDWTQERAQTGTATDVIEGTQDSTKTADAAKVGSDSYVINGAPSYTFQVRDFFPFCIPFDVYDMCSCLAADPVAPSFDWVFPVLGHNYEISIDLSVFNSVAAIVRTMETLAFAVGLAMATKKMIQGGD